MKSKALMKNIKLPDAPEPTRANFHKHPVVGDGKYIKVLPCGYKPRPAPLPRKKNPKKQTKPREVPYMYKRQVWTEERLQAMVDMYLDGVLVSEIGEKLNCSAKSVHSQLTILRREGKLEAKRTPPGWNDEQVKILIEMYEAGRVYADISEVLGKSMGNICDKVHRLQKKGLLEPRHSGRRKKE